MGRTAEGGGVCRKGCLQIQPAGGSLNTQCVPANEGGELFDGKISSQHWEFVKDGMEEMATVVKSMATSGVDGFMVEIEASIIRGQQQAVSIIGLGDQAVKEAGERMQAAIESCGYDIPKDKVIISLAPGDRRKKGSHFDLGMTIALLFQSDQISPKNLGDYAFIGELSLDGRVRPCHGVLSMVTEARKCGVRAVVLPYENRGEASTLSGIRICPVQSLQDTIRFLEGRLDLDRQALSADEENRQISAEIRDGSSLMKELDFSEVRGQEELIEAIVLGAAGKTSSGYCPAGTWMFPAAGCIRSNSSHRAIPCDGIRIYR